METLNPETNLLADDYKSPLEYATTGQRFLNYIIDLASFYGLFFGLVFSAVLITGNADIATEMESLNPILDRVLTLVMFGLYIGLVEGITSGKTLGKMITRTRGVNEDGSRIDFFTGFKRGLYRAVPFEPFSGFGAHPWHDKWTDTRVVKEESLQQ